MSDALNTVTDVATSELVKDLGKAALNSAVITAGEVTAAVLVLAAAGKLVQAVQKRSAKKSTLTVVPE